MNSTENTRERIKGFLRPTPFYPVHIGGYIREHYFWRELRRLPVGQFQYALDAGCGSGHLAMRLARRFGHIDVVGYDLKAEFIKDTLPPNLSLRHKDLLELEESEKYDFVYSIDVLEHIRGNHRVVENICRALKPGGYFFLHMPRDNPGVRIFPERFFEEFESWREKEHIGEHYSPEETYDLLTKTGFEVLRQYESFGYVGKVAWELDRITDGRIILKVLLMPFLRTMARLAVIRPLGPGAVLVVARRPNESLKRRVRVQPVNAPDDLKPSQNNLNRMIAHPR